MPMMLTTTALVAAWPTSVALRPSFQADPAASKRNESTKGEALGQPESDLMHRHRAASLRHEQFRRNVQHGYGDHETTQNADGGAIQIEDWGHQRERQDARQHHVVLQWNPEYPQRVEFIAALHGGDLRRIGAARSPRHHDGSHDGSHLANLCQADEIGDVDVGAEAAPTRWRRRTPGLRRPAH